MKDTEEKNQYSMFNNGNKIQEYHILIYSFC